MNVYFIIAFYREREREERKREKERKKEREKERKKEKEKKKEREKESGEKTLFFVCLALGEELTHSNSCFNRFNL
jgi:flagellar biosynthesis component FlhA